MGVRRDCAAVEERPPTNKKSEAQSLARDSQLYC